MPLQPLLLLLLASHLAYAAEVTSLADSGPGSLRQALRGGSPVTFHPNLAKQTITITDTLLVDREMVIDGTGAPGVTISGGGKVRVFEVSDTNATFIGLTIVDGRATAPGDKGNGGGIWFHGHNKVLNVKSCAFKRNVALGEGGGAIYVGWRHVTNIADCLFEANDGSMPEGERGGGAIATSSEGRLTVKGSRFINNIGGNGAGINSLLGELLVEDCVFTGNTTATRGKGTFGYGAAIYTDGASALIDDPIGGTITVRRCQFTENIGAGQGGAIFLFAYPPDKVIVESSVFTRNQVVADAKGDALGGAFRMGNADFIIRDSAFIENKSLVQGGALWFGEKSTGQVINCTIAGNEAKQGGGAIGAVAAPISFDRCSIVANKGGGLDGPTFIKKECFEGGSASGLILGPDNVPYLKDQTSGARPELAQSTASAKSGKGKQAKEESASKPAPEAAKPAPEKKPAVEMASVIAANGFPSASESITSLKDYLQSELAAGRQPPLMVKLDLVQPVAVKLVGMDARSIRTSTPRGDEMLIPWKLLEGIEFYRAVRPAMLNAPVSAYRQWLVLGLHCGAQRDGGYRQLLGPLWEQDREAAQQFDGLLKQLGL